MKTSLEDMLDGRVRSMENWRQPAGDSQMFEPRPRPVSWKEARKVSGAGRCDSRVGLLTRLFKRYDNEN